jgi:hypothetical protein
MPCPKLLRVTTTRHLPLLQRLLRAAMVAMCLLITLRHLIWVLSMQARVRIGTTPIRAAAATTGNPDQSGDSCAAVTTSCVSCMATLCVAVIGRRADQTNISWLMSLGRSMRCVLKSWGLAKLRKV